MALSTLDGDYVWLEGASRPIERVSTVEAVTADATLTLPADRRIAVLGLVALTKGGSGADLIAGNGTDVFWKVCFPADAGVSMPLISSPYVILPQGCTLTLDLQGSGGSASVAVLYAQLDPAPMAGLLLTL
jgi:hypothetical protein